MINSKRIFITRSIFIIIFALGFMGIVWYNEHKDQPAFIEHVEIFYLDHIYSTENGYLTNEALNDSVKSLNRIFNHHIMERNTSLVSVEAGPKHNIVFNYQYALVVDPLQEMQHLDDYRQLQLIKFCNSPVDQRRLKLTSSYDFIYKLDQQTILNFSITAKDCAQSYQN